MSDSEEDVVAVDVDVEEEDDDDQSDGNNSDNEDALVVVAEAVEEESEDEGAAVEVEVEEPEEEDENVALVVEEEDDDEDAVVAEDEEEEEIVEVAADPQVVVEEDEEALVVEVEAEAVAVAVEEEEDEVVEPPAKRSKINAGKSKARAPPQKKKLPAKKAPASKKKKAPPKRSSASKGKSKKGGSGSSSKSKSSSSGKNSDMHFVRIDSRRMNSANTARELLYETVQKMPFPVTTHPGDTFSVRSFGQLKMATKNRKHKSSSNNNNTKESNNFCTPTSLYPVGFSCDRLEFSPSHGRFLKLRCAILDGTRIGVEGPLFRVMWGQGIDEDKDKVEYPYDPYSNSAPITGNSGDDKGDDGDDDVVVAMTIPTSAGYQPPSSQVAPAVGMRVKTRFDKDKYYYGTITAVTEEEVDTNPSQKGKRQTKGNKKKIELEIAIKYDDGSAEESVFPDPDISLVMPGA